MSAVVSYERAKAESLGYDAKGGLMERAERLIFLGVALLVGYIVPETLVPLLALLLALSSFTAIQRFLKVWRQASPELASSRVRMAPRPRRVALAVLARAAPRR